MFDYFFNLNTNTIIAKPIINAPTINKILVVLRRFPLSFLVLFEDSTSSTS